MQPNPGLYTVTYFRTDEHSIEIVVSRYDVSAEMLAIYRSAPAVALGAARRTQGDKPANGFRIIDQGGVEVLAYKDKVS